MYSFRPPKERRSPMVVAEKAISEKPKHAGSTPCNALVHLHFVNCYQQDSVLVAVATLSQGDEAEKTRGVGKTGQESYRWSSQKQRKRERESKETFRSEEVLFQVDVRKLLKISRWKTGDTEYDVWREPTRLRNDTKRHVTWPVHWSSMLNSVKCTIDWLNYFNKKNCSRSTTELRSKTFSPEEENNLLVLVFDGDRSLACRQFR